MLFRSFLTISVLYMGIVVSEWIDWWGLVGAVVQVPLRPNFASLTFGNPSAVLTVATLFLASSLALIGIATAVRRAIAAVLIALLMLVALFSGSRAGWLGLAIAAAFVATVWLGLPRNRGILGRLFATPRARATLAVVLLGGLALTVLLTRRS